MLSSKMHFVLRLLFIFWAFYSIVYRCPCCCCYCYCFCECCLHYWITFDVSAICLNIYFNEIKIKFRPFEKCIALVCIIMGKTIENPSILLVHQSKLSPLLLFYCVMITLCNIFQLYEINLSQQFEWKRNYQTTVTSFCCLHSYLSPPLSLSLAR